MRKVLMALAAFLVVLFVVRAWAGVECKCEGERFWWKPAITKADPGGVWIAYMLEMAKFLKSRYGDIEQERFREFLGETFKQKITWETISLNILVTEAAIEKAGLELKYISLLGREIGYQYACALMGSFGAKAPNIFRDGVCHLRLWSHKNTGEILTRAILVRDAFGDGAVAEEIALVKEKGFPVMGSSTHEMLPEYKEFLKAVITGNKEKALDILRKQPDPPFCVQVQ